MSRAPLSSLVGMPLLVKAVTSKETFVVISRVIPLAVQILESMRTRYTICSCLSRRVRLGIGLAFILYKDISSYKQNYRNKEFLINLFGFFELTMVVVRERGRKHGAGDIQNMPVMLKALNVRNVVVLIELRTTDCWLGVARPILSLTLLERQLQMVYLVLILSSI